MTYLLAVLAGAAVYAVIERLSARARKRQRGFFGAWPIRRVPIQEFDPSFTFDERGPTVDTEAWFVGTGTFSVVGGTSDFEAWVLAAMAKRAARMFEFGTCTGKTTYLWARNAPPAARIATITLAPEARDAVVAAPGDRAKDVRTSTAESTFTRFLYTGTPVESKIDQLFGDSKALDEAPYEGTMDLIFIDGSHAYSYVMNDSKKALRMVKPGGVVLWHDYRGPWRSAGVFKALNELSRSVPLVHIAGTSLVAHRRAR